MSVQRILVGVDASEASRRAVEWTAELAADLAATAVAIHVYEPLDHLGEIGPSIVLADIRERMRQLLKEVWCAPFESHKVQVERRVVEGVPHEAILATAKEVGADLIVLGARRLGALKAAALGSTSSRVVHDALVPVTIVHGNG